jgi:2'-5' RNA ligase
MGYAIKWFFSANTARPILNIWDKLAEGKLATFLKESGSRPGITLCVWDSGNENELVELANSFIEGNFLPPPIFTFGIANFPTNPAQVFLGVTPTKQLLNFHKQFHEVNPQLSSSGSDYYQPSNWVPHSTLAIRCPCELVPQIIECCMKEKSILEFEIASIGLIETGTASQIAEFGFLINRV